MSKSRPGQILITVLIALTIITLTIVVTSDIVRDDIIDSTQAANYTDYYAATEEAFLRFMNGTASDDCSIENDNPCSITNLFDESRNLIIDEVYFDIQTLRSFSFLEVKKDQGFSLKLADEFTAYYDDIDMSWTGEVIWELNIDYTDSSGQYLTKRSLYSPPSVSSVSTSFSDNCLTFRNEDQTALSFNIGSCISIANQESPLAIRLRPIMLDPSETSTFLSVEGNASLPAQLKSITAISQFDDELTENPSITLTSLIPINSQAPPILDYVLRTESSVNK